MSARVILDTGPLVALLVAREEHHDWAKRQNDATIMTLDRDFTVYRRHGRQPIPLIMPNGNTGASCGEV